MAINTSAINNVIQTDSFVEAVRKFTFSEFLSNTKPLIFFVVGIAIYAIFIFKFYKFLAKRDIIELKTNKYYAKYEGFLKHIARLIFYVLENLILIPLLVFFWFIVLSLLLLFLAKTPAGSVIPDVLPVLLAAAAIVGAIRVTAYYNENLSQDLAKMVPFALLGVYLIDASFFSLSSSIQATKTIPSYAQYLLYYLLFVVSLEFVLRITHGIVGIFIRRESNLNKEIE